MPRSNASYVYNLGDGKGSKNLPSKSTINNYKTYMKTLFGSGKVWSGTEEGFMSGHSSFYVYNLTNNMWEEDGYVDSFNFHRFQLSSL